MREVRLDEETGTATVIVHDYQLSLAIGKEGQNARLAARLTGWRIDIKSETQLARGRGRLRRPEWAEGEWVESEAGEMVFQPAEGGEAISMEEWAHKAEEAAAEDTDAEAGVPETGARRGDAALENGAAEAGGSASRRVRRRAPRRRAP